MAKIKVINDILQPNLNGINFNNITSSILFRFGDIRLETNNQPRQIVNYNNSVSSFVKPITLETLNINEEQSTIVKQEIDSIILNYDKSNLNNYAKFGSLAERLRVAIENIILKYPASLFLTTINNGQVLNTINNYSYNIETNTSTFFFPDLAVVNTFDLIYKFNNNIVTENEFRNLNSSFEKYTIWIPTNPEVEYNIVGYSGSTNGLSRIEVEGDPFNGVVTASVNYHIKPQFLFFSEFFKKLESLERYLLSNKSENGYLISIKEPVTTESGDIIFNDREILWPTSDNYNIDFNTSVYKNFLDKILNVGIKYDSFKTDLVLRFLTPESLKLYDHTDDQKISKLLRIYGREFDEIKKFIDGLTYINSVTYNKIENVPNTLVKNLANTLGLEYVNLLSETDLLDGFFSDTFQNDESILPHEINIELWRRIIINISYLYKAKGTRRALESIFLMLGIPEPFIEINEYVYTVEQQINPDSVSDELVIPSLTNPYDDNGLPVAPDEFSQFFFQISGNTDSGQAYINNYRNVGFNVSPRVDNKKSWKRDGDVQRTDDFTSYRQKSSDLIINTKEIDAVLDVNRGLEFDIWKYNVEFNYPISTTGITRPFFYINIPLSPSSNGQVIYEALDDPMGDIQVSLNGVVLARGELAGQNDYYVDPINTRRVILNNPTSLTFNDRITLTYTTSNEPDLYTQISYVSTRFSVDVNGQTLFTLPKEPLGDVQLSVNGITLTKGDPTNNIGDYYINPLNRREVILKSDILNAYLTTNDIITISFLQKLVDSASSETKKESENFFVSNSSILSSTGGKLFYNAGINRWVYSADINILDVNSVKVVINGLTLANGIDFTLNPSNQSQIWFVPSFNFLLFDKINIFYFVSGDESVINDLGFGDINIRDLTFAQYLDFIKTRLINVKNRKIITDFNGGFYPTLYKIYELYYLRSLSDDPSIRSNGYTFIKLFRYISNFSTVFQKFLFTFLPATTILRKSGVLINNSLFSKQKFTYKRGIDDGSEFRAILQQCDLEVEYNESLFCTVELSDVVVEY